MSWIRVNFFAKLPRFLNSASKVTPRHKISLLFDYFQFFDFFSTQRFTKAAQSRIREACFQQYLRKIRYQQIYLYTKQLHVCQQKHYFLQKWSKWAIKQMWQRLHHFADISLHPSITAQSGAPKGSQTLSPSPWEKDLRSVHIGLLSDSLWCCKIKSEATGTTSIPTGTISTGGRLFLFRWFYVQ